MALGTKRIPLTLSLSKTDVTDQFSCSMFNMYIPIYSPSLTVTLIFYSETLAVQPESAAHQSKYIIMLVHQHCCLPGYFTGIWTFAMVILCSLTLEPACSVKIISDNNYYYEASDISITLNCQFTLDPEDLGNLDIQWNIVPPNTQEDDKLILLYTQSIIHNNLYAPLNNRIYFKSPKPQDGDASISITDLKLTDSGKYQCKVRTLAGEQIKDIFLTVFERPNKPVCCVDDEPVLDTNIRLRCRSSQGTPPIKYIWTKLSENKMLTPDAHFDAPGGDLHLDKITERDSGAYRCTVQNFVGMEDCELILKITSLSTVIDGNGHIAGTTAEITAGVGVKRCELIPNVTSPSTVIDRHGPIAGTTAEITAGVGIEDPESILSMTSASTVIDGHGPIASTPAEITAGVGIKGRELMLNITSPSTVIHGHGPIASTPAEITAGVDIKGRELIKYSS
uniref:coxsackievirus and adenovirus receptor homolog n=1 Tax=Scatophagus argus TaxID=75038 RepID=UPI001ED856E5|nr:coxsackievirus and adenovirus receptor homolog [Scatophagus argus]